MLFLREKARKLYTKVIETAYYQLNSDNFTELKNKEFITLFNKEKQYYKFEAQLNNQYIILMNAPSFDSLFDCTNFYNSIIKNPDINDTNYRIKLPYYVNKNKKSNNISLNKEIYLYKALIDIAKTQFKINIKDEPLKFYENLYYIIENLDENTLINIIKKVHKNNNKNDINANNETIGYELKQCMNDIEKIKKEFPNIKFKNL